MSFFFPLSITHSVSILEAACRSFPKECKSGQDHSNKHHLEDRFTVWRTGTVLLPCLHINLKEAGI